MRGGQGLTERLEIVQAGQNAQAESLADEAVRAGTRNAMCALRSSKRRSTFELHAVEVKMRCAINRSRLGTDSRIDAAQAGATPPGRHVGARGG